MRSSEKRLNEMNRLADMGHFPAMVNLGATVNVLLTISVTWWLAPRFPQPYAPAIWIAIVLALNLLPVVLLRLTLRPETEYPRLGEMRFVPDQHKFSDWVYLAASADMAFWILVSWSAFAAAHSPNVLIAMLVIAFLLTFSPVLLRGFSRGAAVAR